MSGRDEIPGHVSYSYRDILRDARPLLFATILPPQDELVHFKKIAALSACRAILSAHVIMLSFARVTRAI